MILLPDDARVYSDSICIKVCSYGLSFPLSLSALAHPPTLARLAMKPGFLDASYKDKPRHGAAATVRRMLVHYRPRSLRHLLFQLVAAALSVLLVITMLGRYPMHRRWRQRLKDLIVVDDTWRDMDLNTPPRYLNVYEEERRLPQHNLSLPFPEGATGRYVKFTSQINMLGWNNVLNELLMLTHLAYRSNRAYVFQPYIWKWEYYPWKRNKAWHWHPHTPLTTLIAGPTAGGGWPSDDPAPRSVSMDYWGIVCPPHKVKKIWTHKIKKEFGLHWDPNGKQIFDTWNKLLLDDPAQCIEVIAPQRDVEDFAQVFDLWLWGSERILAMWEELRDSPVSQLLRTSPIIEKNIAHNEHRFWSSRTTNVTDPWSHVFAVHIRRGDFEEACLNLANWKSTFYGWNQLPYLPDRFTPAPGGEPGANTPENIKAYYARCLPEPETIINRINDARDDYEKEVYGNLQEHHVHTLYILTNDRSEWLSNLKSRLEAHQWRIVTSSDLVHRNAQEKDVAMATDMDLARRAAIFLGNGWSSFTSNILHRRLVDQKIPISNRFF